MRPVNACTLNGTFHDDDCADGKGAAVSLDVRYTGLAPPPWAPAPRMRPFAETPRMAECPPSGP